MINIKYNTKNIIKGGGFRGNLGSPELYIKSENILKKGQK
jgi:hypothetical protein